MKVKELIKKLTNFNQDMEVRVRIRNQVKINYQPSFYIDDIELTNFDDDSLNEVELIIGYGYVKTFIEECEM